MGTDGATGLMSAPGAAEDLVRVDSILQGSEADFRELVATCQPAMLRLARVYAPSVAVAEEIVQEAWVAVLKSLPSYRGRARLRTWICGILVNVARRYAQRERYTLPLTALTRDDGDGPSVSPDRFFSSGAEYAGHWKSMPSDWSAQPEVVALSHELRDRVRDAIETLPGPQQVVIVLRDVESWASDEVAGLLQITEVHQRVLLHRARSRVRSALEQYLGA